MEWMDLWTGADMAFTAIICITLLVMLYGMSLMSRAIRLLQYQTSVIENDLKLIGEEIKMLARPSRPAGPSPGFDSDESGE